MIESLENSLRLPVYGTGLYLGDLLGGYSIRSFIIADKGIDVEESAYVTLKHNDDSVTLENKVPNSTAYFHVSTTWTKKKPNLLGQPGEIVDSGLDEEDFALKYGQTRTVVNKEGKVDLPGIGKRRFYNRDTTVTFKRIEVVDQKGNVQTEQGATGGSTSVVPESSQELLKYGLVVVGVVGLAIVATTYLTRRPAGGA